MSTEVKTREAMAQPMQAITQNPLASEETPSNESHEDNQTKGQRVKVEESTEGKPSRQTLSAKARKRTKTGCLSELL